MREDALPGPLPGTAGLAEAMASLLPAFGMAQVENEFILSRLTSPAWKYSLFLRAHPPQPVREVRDIILTSATAVYDSLKEYLITSLVACKQPLLQQRLCAEELGDGRSTQFLGHLQQHLEDKASSLDFAFVSEMFLQHLSETLRIGLTAGDSLPFFELSWQIALWRFRVLLSIPLVWASSGLLKLTSRAFCRMSLEVSQFRRKVRLRSRSPY